MDKKDKFAHITRLSELSQLIIKEKKMKTLTDRVEYKGLAQDAQSQSLIDIEALVLFKDHTEPEITGYLQEQKLYDKENAECDEDKLSDRQVKIMERAISFHRTYTNAKLDIERKKRTSSERAAMSLAYSGIYGKSPDINQVVLDHVEKSLNPKTSLI